MSRRGVATLVFMLAVGGCALPPAVEVETRAPIRGALDRRAKHEPVVPAAHIEPLDGPAEIDDLVATAVARNPRIARATFTVDAARGRHIQAGLYPNPDLAINWDEVGDRTGPGGILTAPRLAQTIVTGRKLTLSQAVAATEIDQATLALLGERYAVIESVRAGFYDVLILEKRIEVLEELHRLAEEAVKNGQNLLDNQKIARLDLLQLQIERERFRTEGEAAKRELPPAKRALAAAIGDPRMPIANVIGVYEELPVYDPERVLDVVLTANPAARSAQVGVERAQAAVRRAQAEVIPDLTFYTGYIRQDQNKSNDFAVGVNAPIPVWNRNQGNIRAAQAELGVAMQEIGRVENELAGRVAAAFRTYEGARRRAELFRTQIIPKAQESFDLALKAFQGGQFDYLRVIAAQRVVAEAKLELNKSLGEAWRAAAHLSGLLLEEAWPHPPRELKPETAPPPLPIPPTGKPGR